MLQFLSKPLKGSTVLILVVITNAVYLLMNLWTIPALTELSGGMRIPDMMPMGYDQLYIMKLFLALGLEGQDFYIFRQIPLDMVYPFLFGISYTVLMIWVFARFSALDTSWVNLAFIPLIAGFFDYLENIGIVLMMGEYPEVSETTVNITSVFTNVKSGLTALYFTSLIIVFLFLSIRRTRKRQTT